MKAETLLTLLKKCVLCLFLCTLVENSIAQNLDTTLIRQAVVGQIDRVTTSRASNLSVVGDSTIARYIPTELASRIGGQKMELKKLQYSVDSISIHISFIMIPPPVYDDVAGRAIVTSTINIDSLRNTTGINETGTEDSFWDDTLQPILVTAGAAAVIALFFFVKF